MKGIPPLRLRQIKLAGFKSFADPTLVELRDPFAAIVGPNGCGKSNIIDAVRWVIGEGRISELRGSSSMSELIFSGSAARHSMGRAMVELVLDNSDGTLKGAWAAYGEISVKRVVTREGASTYFINQQQVRRRDVQEIFLGTGLGSRSYAIISQGMISDFIRAKPEELRVYLEEAAGVSLYKERRRETENHLSTTRANLERAHDLQSVRAAEAERLALEAQTAEKWWALTEEKEAREALWYFLQLEEAERAGNEAAAKAAEAESEPPPAPTTSLSTWRTASLPASVESETFVKPRLPPEAPVSVPVASKPPKTSSLRPYPDSPALTVRAASVPRTKRSALETVP